MKHTATNRSLYTAAIFKKWRTESGDCDYGVLSAQQQGEYLLIGLFQVVAWNTSLATCVYYRASLGHMLVLQGFCRQWYLIFHFLFIMFKNMFITYKVIRKYDKVFNWWIKMLSGNQNEDLLICLINAAMSTRSNELMIHHRQNLYCQKLGNFFNLWTNNI